MMKSFKYVLLVGVSLMLAPVAWAVSTDQKLGATPDTEKAAQEAVEFASAIIGFPVLDITSVPAHSIVALEQQFIRLETENENVFKANVKHRLTEIQRAVKTSDLRNGIDKKELGYTYMPSEKQYEQKNTRAEKYRLLSQRRVNPADEMPKSWAGIKEGFIEAKEGSEIEKEGQTSTVDLTKAQQKQWTSAAGTAKAMAVYEAHRDYLEQEQAIRMMAQTIIVKQDVFNKMKKLAEELDAHYKKTDVPGNLQDSKCSKGEICTVNENENATENKDAFSDYNKALREYAYQSLIYDQLLSMEQQILGMRLQIKGGSYGQELKVISDDLETRGIED